MIGQRLGPYEVTAKLGEGGMGEVYRATDSKLRREVAIKVLPAAFTEDKERLARFEREAQLLAQLHHPNIASIFGLEESADATRALVMELVDGEDLSALIARGALPVDEALAIARQIAEALEAAHAKGIIHRDLKPQNVKITPEGRVKVLDFGLAKAMDPTGTTSEVASASHLAASPTLTLGATVQGMILGTAAYMAPEQARGGAVDKRADIWAFGVVLYEMLTGRRLFEGDSVSDVLAGVLKSEIDFERLPATTPSAIRRLLRRCLERNPRNRLHDIADARIVLDELAGGARDELPPPAGSGGARWRTALALAAAALAVGALAGWLAAGGREASPAATPIRTSIVFPEDLVVEAGLLSPDGGALYLLARRRDDATIEHAIYRRALGAAAPDRIPGTDGSTGFLITPDARSLVFLQRELTDPSEQRVMRMPTDGSQPPVELAEWDPAWSDLGLLTSDEPVVLVDETALRSLAPSAEAESEPVVIDAGRPGTFSLEVSPPLPGDRRLLLSMQSWTGRGFQLSTALVDATTGRGSVVIEDGANAFYAAPGRLLFSRGSTLHGVRFEADSGTVSGERVALVEGLRIEEAWEAARFSYSNDGTLAFAAGGLVGAERRFVVFDPESGQVEPWGTERRAFRFVRPEPSSDARAVYAQLANARGTYEIWRVPRAGPAQPIVAETEADAQGPALSPDGRWIAFTRVARQPSDGLYIVPVDRSAPPRELLRVGAERHHAESWTGDGRRLLAQRQSGGEYSIVEVDVATGDSRTLAGPPAWQGTPSPDGRRLAFGSDVSGRPEIYVADYPAEGTVGERIAVSRGGGLSPRWSPDGRWIYYHDFGQQLLRVPLAADGRPAGEPGVVADLGELRAPEVFNVLPDGRLLLLQRGSREGKIHQFDLVLHFDRVLAERLP
jgi:hypothetical protein